MGQRNSTIETLRKKGIEVLPTQEITSNRLYLHLYYPNEYPYYVCLKSHDQEFTFHNHLFHIEYTDDHIYLSFYDDERREKRRVDLRLRTSAYFKIGDVSWSANLTLKSI